MAAEDPADETPMQYDLSPNNGEGEYSMKVFVQQHMMSILQPIAEHVMELQKQAQQLQQSMALTEAKLGKTDATVDHQSKKLSDLAANHRQTKTDIEGSVQKVQTDLASTNSDHSNTKASLGKSDKQIEDMQSSVQELHRVLEEKDGSIGELQRALTEANSRHDRVKVGVAELKSFHEGLNDRHLELIKGHQKTKNVGEHTELALKNLTKAFEKQVKEDGLQFAHVDAQLKNLFDHIHRVELQGNERYLHLKNHLAATDEEVRRLRVELDSVKANPVFRVTGEASVHLANPVDLLRRIIGCEDGLVRADKNLQLEKRKLLDKIEELGTVVSKHTTDIRELDQVQMRHGEQIVRADQRSQEVQGRNESIEAQIDKVEKEIMSINEWKSKTNGRIRAQEKDLEKTRAHLNQTSKDMETAHSNLESLGGKLEASNDHAAKLNSKLNLAHEYFQGFSKGFRDTHKTVAAGEGGMLAPKGSQTTMMLPALPQSERAGNVRPYTGESTLSARPTTAGTPR